MAPHTRHEVILVMTLPRFFAQSPLVFTAMRGPGESYLFGPGL